MSLDLTAQDVDEIWMEAEQQCPPVTSIDRLEMVHNIPSILGSGYCREIELYPGLDLCVHREIYHHDMISQAAENQHLVQFEVLLSGVSDGGDLVRIDAEQSYVGGSGIQRSFQCFSPQAQPLIGVNIHMQPHLLSQFFAAPTGELPIELQPLVRGGDWQRIFSPKTTGAMRSVVQQIIDCPFWGATKRLYLQAKVFELMALQLHSIVPAPAANSSLKPSTIARIHQAADLLRSRLEHPPSQTELARQVGVSDRTLQRGFRELFNTTAFGYLHNLRMEQAEQLLRNREMRVSEVAHAVGYGHLGHFTEAFKRKFGMTPKQCQNY